MLAVAADMLRYWQKLLLISYWRTILVVFVTNIWIRLCYTQSSSYFAMIKEGYRLKGWVLSESDVRSTIECIVFCQQDVHCTSINIQNEEQRNGRRKCELNNNTLLAAAAKDKNVVYPGLNFEYWEPVKVDNKKQSVVQESSVFQCNVDYTILGCYQDWPDSGRIFSRLLITERDLTAKQSSGIEVDWHDYKNYLNGFTCRCLKAAQDNGYIYIGLQNHGECWSDPYNNATYGRHGKGSKCVDGEFVNCDDSSLEQCVGTDLNSYIYELV